MEPEVDNLNLVRNIIFVRLHNLLWDSHQIYLFYMSSGNMTL